MAAKKAVADALETNFRPDPILTPALSQLLSFASSAAKRHGPLIELGIGNVLESGGLTVLRNLRVPITRGALALIGSVDYPRLVGSQIDFNDNDIVDFVDVDIIAIDEPNRWAGAFSVKRGGGQTETRKRKDGERLLRALNFILASWLRKQGYGEIEVAAAAVIDYFGQSGFAKDLTIGRSDLDAYFGLAIVQDVDAMTAAMHAAIEAEMGALLAPIFESIPPVSTKQAAANTELTSAPVTKALLRPRRGAANHRDGETFPSDRRH
jgi:hypothetical protein